MRVLSILLVVVCQSLLGCSGWQEMSGDKYYPAVGDFWIVTRVDGSIYEGRVQEQSTWEKLVLELVDKSGVILTMPRSQIRRIQYYRPIY